MSPHQTIALAVRLFAIWFAIHVTRGMLEFYVAGNRNGDPNALPIALTISLLAVLFILFLWFFPLLIARGLLPSAAAEPAPPASPDVWFAVGCGLIGLWVLAWAVPALTRNLLVLYLVQSSEVDISSLRSALLYYLAQVVIGVWLFLGASGVRKVFWWARNAGHH